MKTVLFIKGTPQIDELSRSTTIAKVFVDEYKKANPADEVIELDVYNMELPLVDLDVLNGWNKLRNGGSLTEEEQKKVEAIAALTEQFIQADKVIVQSPLWNLGVPPLLKAYFDTVTIAGKTFKYTEQGPVGLMEGKKAIHIHGSGGTYSQTTGIEHGDSYVRGILSFLRVEVLPTIFVEGIDHHPEQKEAIMTALTIKAKEAAIKF